jgi:peptidyl-prolyl cis-trans isomerase SurA
MDLLEYSEDRRTRDKMGELPEFGINKMMPAFEEAAFALENPGDYSAPVQTSIGWHVIQLIEKKPIGTYENLEKELARKVKRDSRNTIGAKRFVKQLKHDYGFKVDERGYAYAKKLVDMEAFSAHAWELPKRYQDRTVATFANQSVKVGQLLEFWANNQQVEIGGKGDEFLRLQFNTLCNDKIVTYEDSQLEKKYPEFRNLVREYKEGILLFDLTQDEVWDRAAQDSAGLALEYNSIKSNFMWDDRITFNYWVCKDEKDAKKIAKWLSKNKREKVDELLESQDALNIAYSSGLAQQKDDQVLAELWQFEKGVYGPSQLEKGGYAVLLVESTMKSRPKAFNEIKGLVIASYQERLEKMWIESLRQKFKVEINEEVRAFVLEELN